MPPAREKQRVILFCAPVTLLFTVADTLALGRFSWTVFAVRLAWTALIVGCGLLLPRLGPVAEGRVVTVFAVASTVFFGVLTQMTGGRTSPLFHWILAMPLVVAVVIQEHPRATAAAAVATLASGVTILARGGQGAAACVEWLVPSLGMSSLAVYASVIYRRLRQREQAMREASLLAQERARASEDGVRARDVFLTVASHELRTPLTALRLQADRILPRVPAGTVRDGLTVMLRQVERMTDLVEALLDVSRLTTGRLDLELAEGDLAAVARLVVERHAQTAERQGCTLELEAGGPVRAVFDGLRVGQVLSSLLSNAIKFGAGAPVHVSVRAEGDRGRVTVRDHGAGIAPEDQSRIFQRFERAVSHRHYGGLGLGLWISRQVVERLGGTLTLESEPGTGATFTVELPLARETSHSVDRGMTAAPS